MMKRAPVLQGAGDRAGAPVPRPSRRNARLGRRFLADRLARRVVTLGGATIIAAILAILVVMVLEVIPLFRPATAAPVDARPAAEVAAPLAVEVDEYREIACLLTASGPRLVSLAERPVAGVPDLREAVEKLGGERVTSACFAAGGRFALGLADGRVVPGGVEFKVAYGPGETRRVEAAVVLDDPIETPAAGAIEVLAHSETDKGPITAVAAGGRRIAIVTIEERKALIGPATRTSSAREIELPGSGEITALAVDGRGDYLFAGTGAGEVIKVELGAGGELEVKGAIAASSRAGAAVTVLGFLIGDRTLVAGDAAGGVGSWQLLPGEGGAAGLVKVNDFEPHREAVLLFSASRRNKGFLTGDAGGDLRLHYGTTGNTQLSLEGAGRKFTALTLAPKFDGIIAADSSGALSHWALRNPHPESSLHSIFGKVWYEGYSGPEYVWQSTGGTDDFEAKFSLVPLIFGTVKGTIYALLFAVPLSVLAAVYVSQFMHPGIRSWVKDAVEVMAALPSVVLGFIAALWLAPKLEKVVPGIFLMPVVIPALILAALGLWRALPRRVRGKVRAGWELAGILPVVILGGLLSLQLGAALEGFLLGGDYRGWLLEALGLTYDQRNSIVVGFAMGIAVIPVIFTIAEDSISSVPHYLKAGSLALGATPWQTVLRVVLPSASPGIFSAVMIGLGRAAGETMIVLMATGNTPVMDWSIFNGFRALSANIAVELPEAPEGGTLFRVLFLAALILFAMTFTINTGAEVIRLWLRQRYRYHD